MRSPLNRLRSRLLHMLPAQDRQPPRRAANPAPEEGPRAEHPQASLYHAWLASRVAPAAKGVLLTPGAHRPLSRDNVELAVAIARRSFCSVFALLCELHPWRLAAMVAMDLFRGVFPAFRGYSQALIINEVSQTLFAIICRALV